MANSVEYKFVAKSKCKNKELWQYFGFRSLDGKTPLAEFSCKVYCNINGCKDREQPYSGNTTNLSRHLQQYHPAENLIALGQSPSPGRSLMPPITSFLSSSRKLSLTDVKAKKVTNAIVSCIVKNLRPMSMHRRAGCE
jgi:hypothetical protein